MSRYQSTIKQPQDNENKEENVNGNNNSSVEEQEEYARLQAELASLKKELRKAKLKIWMRKALDPLIRFVDLGLCAIISLVVLILNLVDVDWFASLFQYLRQGIGMILELKDNY